MSEITDRSVIERVEDFQYKNINFRAELRKYLDNSNRVVEFFYMKDWTKEGPWISMPGVLKTFGKDESPEDAMMVAISLFPGFVDDKDPTKRR